MGGCQQEGPVRDHTDLGISAHKTVYMALVETACCRIPITF